MSQPSHILAPRDRWTAAVYEVKDSRTWLIGSGVVIDDHRIFTCVHVVRQTWEEGGRLRVSFPKANVGRESYEVVSVQLAEVTDVAVLRLEDPVPARVRPAPLRTPEPASLANERWWSFGLTKEPKSHGAAVHGVIGDALAWGSVALMTGSRERVRAGFSGAGIWCERYQAVVGIIGQAREGGEHPGDALGISMHQIAQDLPADAEVRASLPAGDSNVKARIGTVACAIHAKSKSAIDVAAELARAASVRIPREVDDLVPALREGLLRRGNTRFNIVVDALDEASTPLQVRDILSRILLPLVQTCSDVGAQVVIGTRRSDDGGDLIKAIGTAGEIVNLDAPAYFADEIWPLTPRRRCSWSATNGPETPIRPTRSPCRSPGVSPPWRARTS